MELRYSFIVPVYNRPEEIHELLESMQEMHGEIPFQVVIIEDGSTQDARAVIDSFRSRIDIHYIFKENSGPGDSRNRGMREAEGNYFVILDSDCILPKDYLQTVDAYLANNYVDCFGGADDAHQDFTDLQKAINYSMTAFLTTGGIRGSEQVRDFEPRSFNMGLSKQAFEATGGFARIHPGEDPDLSLRLKKAGYKTAFIPGAAVYHKRRISWAKFQQQVHKFGMVRPILNRWHPESAKITYWFPFCFMLFTISSILLGLGMNVIYAIPWLLYMALVFLDALLKTANLKVAFLSLRAVLTQFFGYGSGFIKSTYWIHWRKRDAEKQFPQLFFN